MQESLRDTHKGHSHILIDFSAVPRNEKRRIMVHPVFKEFRKHLIQQGSKNHVSFHFKIRSPHIECDNMLVDVSANILVYYNISEINTSEIVKNIRLMEFLVSAQKLKIAGAKISLKGKIPNMKRIVNEYRLRQLSSDKTKHQKMKTLEVRTQKHVMEQ